MTIDETKLSAFMGRFVKDLGAAMHAATVVVGDQLGLYKALADEPMTAEALAARTATDPRYVREWLSAQAASDYVMYDALTQRFSLSEEQALALAVEGSPAFIPGAFQITVAQYKAIPKIIDAFRTGKGVGWHEHDVTLFHGTERFFRPCYAANIAGQWIPALEGMMSRLEHGALVADVGCGHGASTILMAQAFPKSRFRGFDYHEPSIDRAREAARAACVEDRVAFNVSAAKHYPGTGYDFVTTFDCLHDLGDPSGAAKHVCRSLKPDGTWMIVEPFAHDQLAQNLNPTGRVYYSGSTFICTPASRSQEVGLCLGAQAGETRIRDVVTGAGFSRFRRVAESQFNLVYEARP